MGHSRGRGATCREVRYRPGRRRPRRATAGRPVRPRQRPVARDDRRSPRTAAATAPSTCCARPPRSTCAPSSRRSPPAPPRRARSRPRSATSTRASWTRTPSRRSGVAPLADDLARVAAVADAGDVVALSGALGRAGVLGLVIPFVNTDDRDPGRYVVYLEQAGLGLPDESYYREDAHADKRTAYVAHVERMLSLAGWPDPEGAAGRVMALETRLAAGHWDKVTNRDPVKTYTLVDLDGLAEMGPGIDWVRYLEGLGAGPEAFDAVVVRQPDHVRSMATALVGGAGRGVARLARAGTSCTRTRPTCRPPSSRRTSTSTGAPCRACRRCASAGSAASAWSRRRSARPSGSSTSSGTSRRTPRSGWSSSSTTSSRPSGAACRRCRGWVTTPGARR